MEKIFFLRHAITDAHVAARKKATMGFLNIGLNEKGKVDCEIMAEKLKKLNIEYIISSDLLSAKETAEIINERLHVPIYYTELLRERNQGEFTGKSLKKIYEDNKDFSIMTCGDNRESLHAFIKRTKETFKIISEDYMWNNCLVISHKGFLRTLMVVCFGINPGNWYLCELREVLYDEKTSKWIQGKKRRLEME